MFLSVGSFKAFGTPGKVVGVIPGIAVDLAVIQFHHPCGDLIQKTAVVGDENSGAPPCGKEIFDPFDSLNIQMVGWLIKEQQIGFRDNGARQSDTPFFPSRSVEDRGGIVTQMEFFHDLIQLVFQMPCFVTVQQLFDPLMFGVGELAFVQTLELIEPLKPFADIFSGRKCVIQLEILRHDGDPQIPFLGDLCVEGDLDTCNDFEQSGLAAAVASDHGNAFAFKGRDGGIVKDDLFPNAQIEVFSSEKVAGTHESSKASFWRIAS